ncbi:2-oxoglutarate dehydrogenase complex, dihydrolipoamide acetyltransferase E2 component [Psychromonas ingrahamii 37]|uniref:Acetyltransferase component of pyruvate dehydrogenase complex n=1 Tax=Psychromonas ingrahamii (strain DSM 17664 / CCUG 51855 / 37) TaxID=357804 RepID=A1SYR3_PSYIN|nr:dihydrolipoyllysine-residue acetyltransferase [Psychromonas ingrahamii]ABM04628.1 2-oxoglutarate dehydrogenase complex, dihydrolipoamide acetyltransferase E2 component [Psychromonas ingrahamii 37]
MSELKEFLLPDIGADAADITDILVSVGDTIAVEQDVLTIEGDKASMDVPSSVAGVVKEIKVKVGDSVSEGNLVLMVEVEVADADAPAADAPAAEAPASPVEEASPAVEAPAAATTQLKEISVPDIGGDEVEVTAILVSVGDSIAEEQDILTVEGDKASMDVPAPFAGVVKEIKAAVGDKVSEGSLILVVEVQGAAPAPAPAAAEPAPTPAEPAPAAAAPVAAAAEAPKAAAQLSPSQVSVAGSIKASPSVRRTAREFNLDLSVIPATGIKGRTTKEDVQTYVKAQLLLAKSGGGGGLQVLASPKVDFAKFGEVEVKPLSRIQKISGPTLHRNWVTIPHVTQFDEVDITELEAFRKEQNAIAVKRDLGLKISPLVFMMKAVAKALQQYPDFNSSLSADGESLILKKYINIGIAVDTPNGLVVPVVKDVINKGIYDLSRELGEISKKARAGKLTTRDMQGGSMTISSLGGIGGTQFTPIVNAPEVAILGVSKSAMKPLWNGKEFEPRLMVPLALSYDHRVIDGAEGARFITAINNYLSDLRTLIL